MVTQRVGQRVKEGSMKAIITGITGQDGSYLAEFLLSRGYEVHGTVRHSSAEKYDRINHIIDRIHLHQADLFDQLTLIRLIEDIRPDEIYNLASYNSPESGWPQPVTCGLLNALSVVRLLEAIRIINPDIKFFQASSADMFGCPDTSPQNENTPFNPETPYASAKLYAHRMTVNYREQYGLNASTAILYDHESPRRSTQFLTRQITRAAARIKLGLQDKLNLETLKISRDWGFAGDYVRSFWMMLQRPDPEDYIIATGSMHSLEDFVKKAFAAVNLNWQDFVVVAKGGHRPGRECPLCGDTTRARRKLLWEPEVSFDEMIKMMVDADMAKHSFTNRLRADLARSEAWRWSMSRQEAPVG